MSIEIAQAFRILETREVPDDPVRATELVRKGLPFRSLAILARRTGLPVSAVEEALDFSARTLSRRKAEKHFSGPESERLVRLARIVAFGQQVLGDPDALARWLVTSNRALGGKTPLSLLGSEIGAQAVEDVLGRIAYGVIS